MKALWTRMALRIDALSLRERVFLFVSILVGAVALVDVAWLSPAQSEHAELRKRYERQSAELARLRDELRVLGQPAAAVRGPREDLEAVNIGIQTMDARIRESLPSSADTGALRLVLTQLLRRHDGLTLVRTVAVPPQRANSATQGPQLLRQGVELTVRGSYDELAKYLRTLELELPHVRWGVVKIKGEHRQPSELTLQLYLLGVAT